MPRTVAKSNSRRITRQLTPRVSRNISSDQIQSTISSIRANLDIIKELPNTVDDDNSSQIPPPRRISSLSDIKKKMSKLADQEASLSHTRPQGARLSSIKEEPKMLPPIAKQAAKPANQAALNKERAAKLKQRAEKLKRPAK